MHQAGCFLLVHCLTFSNQLELTLKTELLVDFVYTFHHFISTNRKKPIQFYSISVLPKYLQSTVFWTNCITVNTSTKSTNNPKNTF